MINIDNDIDTEMKKLLKIYINSLEVNKIDSPEHLLVKENIVKEMMKSSEEHIMKTLDKLDVVYKIYCK